MSGIDRHFEGLRHIERGMGGNVVAMTAAIILPAMIEAGDVIAAHETERELHAAMRATIFPDMRDAAVVAPNHQFPVQQTRTGRTAGLDRMRQTEGMPTILGVHLKLPSRRQIDVMAHHVEHETIKGTEAARHLESVDQFDSAGHIQGDGLHAGLPELKVEPKPFGAMLCEFDKACGLECALKDETRVFMGHRRLVRSSVRASGS